MTRTLIYWKNEGPLTPSTMPLSPKDFAIANYLSHLSILLYSSTGHPWRHWLAKWALRNPDLLIGGDLIGVL